MLKKRGFTLLEMILVISLMGILASTFVPLLDTKEVKIDSVKKLANEVFLVQEALLNHYIDNNGSRVPEFATSIGQLINDGFLSTYPKNIFFNGASFKTYETLAGYQNAERDATGKQWKLEVFKKNVNGVQKDIGVGIEFSIPAKYYQMVKMYLPQVRIVDRRPDGYAANQVYLVQSFIPAPGSEARHDNLLHRDSGAIQELRTMHGALGIVDNLDGKNSKIVISNLIPNTNQPLIKDGYATGNGTIYGGANDLGSLTIGMLETNMTGIRGVSPNTSNLIIDAYNPNKTGKPRGHVVIGAYESDGVVLGANDDNGTPLNPADDSVKTRVLVDKDGTYFASYDYPAGGTPQWISKIDNQGQTWHRKGNQNEVLARMDATDGSFVTRNSVGVIANGDGNPSNFSWSNAQRTLNMTAGGRSDYSVALTERDEVHPNAATGRGAILIADECGTGVNPRKCSGLDKNERHISIIDKNPNFAGPSFIGSIVHIGHYKCGEQLDNWSQLYDGANFRTVCAGGYGRVKPIVTGVVGSAVSGQTDDIILSAAAVTGRNSIPANSNKSKYQPWRTKVLQHDDLGYKGFNTYVANNGVVTCSVRIRGGEGVTADNVSGYVNPGASSGYARYEKFNYDLGRTNPSSTKSPAGSAQIKAIVNVMYVCMPIDGLSGSAINDAVFRN